MEACVVQVIAECEEVQVLRPSSNGGTKLCAGSGVIIDGERGLIITNAHVVGNSRNIMVLTASGGKNQIKAELVSIMREKDLALIHVDPESLVGLKDAKLIDHLKLKQGCGVFAAGFPLGSRQLQISNGCYSGISSNDSFAKLCQFEDSTSRDPVFIVTSASLNHGMSGGGLFDENYNLVGIITAGLPGANQIGYAIPSRTIFSNFKEMLNKKFPVPPTFHFRWSNLSKETLEFLCKSQNHECGVMIRHVLPDSPFYKIMQRGDVLQKLEFELPVIEEESLKSRNKNSIPISATVESCGDLTLTNFDDRKFSLSEIADYLPEGSNVKLFFKRGSEDHQRDITYNSQDQIFRIRALFSSPDFLKLDGIIMQDSTLNIFAECSRYKYISEIPYYDDLIFTPSVVITYVEPSSKTGSLSVFAEGDLVIFVNGKKIRSIEDIRDLVENQERVCIENDRGGIAVLEI